jgi:hypothetical protein
MALESQICLRDKICRQVDVSLDEWCLVSLK